jgi:hypothetical protein
VAGLAGHVTPADVVDRGDRWELPVDGVQVCECCADFAVSIRLSNEVGVRIEQPFVYTTADGVGHRSCPRANRCGSRQARDARSGLCSR